MATQVAKMGGGMRVSSNSFNLSFRRSFSSSILAIEKCNASHVTLWMEDNFYGNMFRVSIEDKNFPLLIFEVFSKIILLESLSN